MNKPKVSVCMLAYNNHSYTLQAIESILMQNVNFDVELIIGEDASTDCVRDVIKKYAGYASRHINVQCYFNDKNVGLTKNLSNTIARCKGEYIAYLDNDDYWIDKNKLQKQVDFLDAHQKYVICHHPVLLLKGNKIVKDNIREIPSVTNINHLAAGNFIRSCSALCRSNAFDGFPTSYYKSPVNDYFYFLLLAKNGLIKKLDSVMAVYRIHPQSDWATRSDQDIKILEYLATMIGCFDVEIDNILKKRYQNIAVKSLFKRLNEPGFDDRLKRCMLFGTEELQSALIKSGLGKTKGNLSYYIDRVKSYL